MNKWLNDLKNTSFYFSDKFNEISLTTEVNKDDDIEEESVLENCLPMNSAYSAFLRYYFSQKNHFLPQNYVNHPFYSNYEPLYTTWGVDFIGTVDYIWFLMKFLRILHFWSFLEFLHFSRFLSFLSFSSFSRFLIFLSFCIFLSFLSFLRFLRFLRFLSFLRF